jgi:DNA polymerase-3 subunit epsilon
MKMQYTPESLLKALVAASPRPTSDAPRDARGVYGLVDHLGTLRYIGSTSSTSETLYKRIHQRHRTGSEDSSHYFSRMYNTGRMWRARNDPPTKADGDIAKALRNAFVSDHCRAVWISLPDSVNISQLEMAIIAIAPAHAIAWNRRGMDIYEEPADLVDITLRRLNWGAKELAAIMRQNQRSQGIQAPIVHAIITASTAGIPPFPQGPLRFVALDVETANNDRGSICQIGIACVRPDNTIETWVTHIDPETDVWLWTGLHGISARTVRGAPTFSDVLPFLEAALAGLTIYQHSGFDRSAISAACATAAVEVPFWQWRDSVTVARQAWPELKGNGGHGLASLKLHLGLKFNHHDAGEDARAAAEVVLKAEGGEATPKNEWVKLEMARAAASGRYEVLEDDEPGDSMRPNAPDVWAKPPLPRAFHASARNHQPQQTPPLSPPASGVGPLHTRTGGGKMILKTADAERLLCARFGEPAKAPTNYVIGFHTRTGKVLAMHRKAAETRIWFQPPAPPVIDGVRLLDEPSNGNSNINGPLLPLARPNTLRVEIDGPLALQRFLDWYEGGKVA